MIQVQFVNLHVRDVFNLIILPLGNRLDLKVQVPFNTLQGLLLESWGRSERLIHSHMFFLRIWNIS